MILKQLNDKLGPKKITAESQMKEIGQMVKKKTGETYQEVKNIKELPTYKRKPIVPQRKVDLMKGNSFHPTKSILKKHEVNMQLLDKTLSKLKTDTIHQIKDEKKAGQIVYRPFSVSRYSNIPLTKLERNMMLFTEIFIEPERERIR